jgi:hypothetical protein
MVILENSPIFENKKMFLPEFTKIHQSLEQALSTTGSEEIHNILHGLSKHNVGGLIFSLDIFIDNDV